MEAKDVQKTNTTLMHQGPDEELKPTDARGVLAGCWLLSGRRCRDLLLVSAFVVLGIVVCAFVAWTLSQCNLPDQEGVPKQCGREWIVCNGTCYLWENHHDWESCQAFCDQKGSRLLSFHSQEEMTSVSKYLRIEECWLQPPSGAGPSSSSENAAAFQEEQARPEGTSKCAYVVDSRPVASGCSVPRCCLCVKAMP